MKQVEMQKVLDELNKKWKIDFVSATAGDCCNTCSTFKTSKEDQAYEDADTILIVKWFYSGMNYEETFEKTEVFHIRYDLGSKVTTKQVCKDLESKLGKQFKVIEPKDVTETIQLIRK